MVDMANQANDVLCTPEAAVRGDYLKMVVLLPYTGSGEPAFKSRVETVEVVSADQGNLIVELPGGGVHRLGRSHPRLQEFTESDLQRLLQVEDPRH